MKFRWGIFGTGEISAKFVEGFRYVQNAEITFVASRNKKDADNFASMLKIPRAIEGYYEASKSKLADIIYIATPVFKHEEHALMCIERSVSVLIEKPFAMNSESAKKIAQAANSKSVFAMEAVWTRFLPAAIELKNKLQKHKIGIPKIVSGNFGVSKEHQPTHSHQNDGSLFQLGIYPLSLSQWLFGKPSVIQAIGNINNHGIDTDLCFQISFENGVIGNFHSSINSWSQNNFQIMGTHGKIRFNGPVVRPYGLLISKQKPLRATKKNYNWYSSIKQKHWVNQLAQIFGKSSTIKSKKYNYFYKGNGYHYQAIEANLCLLNGKFESINMPLNDSICVIETMEKIIKVANNK